MAPIQRVVEAGPVVRAFGAIDRHHGGQAGPVDKSRLMPAANGRCPCGLLSAHTDLSDGNEERLARLYGMTSAESRLAVLLACGHSLATAARLLDVSLTTVRTHLQRIFSKTFTHSQAQLIALLLLGPARLKVQYQPPEEDYSEAG